MYMMPATVATEACKEEYSYHVFDGDEFKGMVYAENEEEAKSRGRARYSDKEIHVVRVRYRDDSKLEEKHWT